MRNKNKTKNKFPEESAGLSGEFFSCRDNSETSIKGSSVGNKKYLENLNKSYLGIIKVKRDNINLKKTIRDLQEKLQNSEKSLNSHIVITFNNYFYKYNY